MKINKTLTALIAGASIGMSGQAFAAGTAAGSDITNTVTLDYSVSGTSVGTSATATSTFKVDHKVDFTVARVNDLTNATPGIPVALKFTVTNTGNAFMDFSLSAAELGFGTDNIELTSDYSDDVILATLGTPFYDRDNDGVKDTDADDAINEPDFIDALDFDDSGSANVANVTILVTLTTLDLSTNATTTAVKTAYNDSTANDGDGNPVMGLVKDKKAGVTLTVQAGQQALDLDLIPTTTADGLNGTVYATDSSASANTDAMQIVFADALFDNSEMDVAGVNVSTPQLTVSKDYVVTDDGLANTAGNEKAIPGATVRYTITVTNDGNASVSSYDITDTLPTEITLIALNPISDSGAESGGVITWNISSALAAGATKTLTVDATIN